MSENIIPKIYNCACGCGRKMTPNYLREKIADTRFPGYLGERDGKPIKILGYGYHSNNVFLTLSCALRWALRQFQK